MSLFLLKFDQNDFCAKTVCLNRSFLWRTCSIKVCLIEVLSNGVLSIKVWLTFVQTTNVLFELLQFELLLLWIHFGERFQRHLNLCLYFQETKLGSCDLRSQTTTRRTGPPSTLRTSSSSTTGSSTISGWGKKSGKVRLSKKRLG